MKTTRALFIIILQLIISCSKKKSDSKINDTSSFSTLIDSSAKQPKKNILRYFENSNSLTRLDTTSDSSTFVTFMNAVTTLNTPIPFDSLFNYNSDEFWITQRVNEYDSIMFFRNESAGTLSNRILSEDSFCRNEISFLAKFFKGLHTKYSPYDENFPQEKIKYCDLEINNIPPLFCVHFKINLSHRKKQRFYLLYITASMSGGIGTDNFLCTFNNKGQLQDCMTVFWGGHDEEGAIKFDNNDNIVGHYLQYKNQDSCRTRIDTMNYKIKISNHGQFVFLNKTKGHTISDDSD